MHRWILPQHGLLLSRDRTPQGAWSRSICTLSSLGGNKVGAVVWLSADLGHLQPPKAPKVLQSPKPILGALPRASVSPFNKAPHNHELSVDAG